MTFNAKITAPSTQSSQAANQANICLPAACEVALLLSRAKAARVRRQGDASAQSTNRDGRLACQGVFVAPECRDGAPVLVGDSHWLEIQRNEGPSTSLDLFPSEPRLETRESGDVVLPWVGGAAAMLMHNGHAEANPASPNLSKTPTAHGALKAGGVAMAERQGVVDFPDVASMTIDPHPQVHSSAASIAAQPKGKVIATAIRTRGRSNDLTRSAFVGIAPMAKPKLIPITVATGWALIASAATAPPQTESARGTAC